MRLRLSLCSKAGPTRKTLRGTLAAGHLWEHATAHNDNTFFAVRWDLKPLRGEVVTLEIVDHSRDAYGFIGVRDFVIARP